MGDLSLPEEDVSTLFPGSSPARPPEPATSRRRPLEQCLTEDVFDPEDHPIEED